ncbi:hypothetical protein D3C84_693450 [compost metagenome]
MVPVIFPFALKKLLPDPACIVFMVPFHVRSPLMVNELAEALLLWIISPPVLIVNAPIFIPAVMVAIPPFRIIRLSVVAMVTAVRPVVPSGLVVQLALTAPVLPASVASAEVV